MLGLAFHLVYDKWGSCSAPSLFQNVIQQGLLDQNPFAIQLSRTDDERDQIIFSSLPEDTSSEKLIEVLLDYRRNCQECESWKIHLSSGWQVSANNIAIPSEEHTTVISSSYPHISLSDEAVARINGQLDGTRPKPGLTAVYELTCRVLL